MAVFCLLSFLCSGISSAEKGKSLYEKIFESYLKEDYATVERLALEYAAGQNPSSQKEDVMNLRALSLMKLGREAEGIEELGRLEAEDSPTQIVP